MLFFPSISLFLYLSLRRTGAAHDLRRRCRYRFSPASSSSSLPSLPPPLPLFPPPFSLTYACACVCADARGPCTVLALVDRAARACVLALVDRAFFVRLCAHRTAFVFSLAACDRVREPVADVLRSETINYRAKIHTFHETLHSAMLVMLFLAYLIVTLSGQWVHFFNDPTSCVAPIMTIPIMKSLTKRVTISLDPAGPALASARHHHRPQRGTFAHTIPLSPQLPPGSSSLSNIIVVQDTDNRSTFAAKFRRPSAHYHFPTARARPPPLLIRCTHACPHEPAEPHARTATSPRPPRSARPSARAFTPVATFPGLGMGWWRP